VIDDWSSYSVADFIPFTAEVYLRLIERVGERWWPLHAVTVAVGLVILWCAWTQRPRPAGVLLAAMVAWVAVVFVMGPYAELNWAGDWIGLGWLFGAMLLMLFALLPGQARTAPRSWSLRATGGVLCVPALLGYPMIAALAGHGWSHSETFGLHADPTAVFWLGLTLISLQGWRAWLSAAVPVLWCLLSALTLRALDLAWAGVLPAAVMVALVGLVVSLITRMTRSASGGQSAACPRAERANNRRH
jgi:hypothetical protein